MIRIIANILLGVVFGLLLAQWLNVFDVHISIQPTDAAKAQVQRQQQKWDLFK
jgi:hypothetical protein